MSNPWQKIRDSVSARAAFEGLVLLDRGAQALVDVQAQDSEADEHSTAIPHNPHAFERLNSPQLSFDDDESHLSFNSDELRLDTDMGIPIDEEGVDAVEEGLVGFDDKELELEDMDIELAGDFEDSELTNLDEDASADEAGELWREFNEAAAANSTHALLNAVLPSWDEDDTVADTFDEDDAEADILMGMLLAGMAEEVGHMRGPYGQIPTSKDWFSVSM